MLQDEGCKIEIGGHMVTIHGAVLCVCGDTPASIFLGGFKEGVGFSLCKCRCCLATAESLARNVSSMLFIHTY